MKRWLLTGRALLSRKQGSILSAAFLVMVLLLASRVLGLVRQRVLANYFSAEDLAVYFAAFRLPETLFEVLVAGSLASAFIPVFTSLLSRGEKRRAWYVAGITQTSIFITFVLLSLVILVFANELSRLLAPGFPPERQALMATLTRFLLLAQGFFLLSFFIGGAQEATGRFLVPAIAPLFYNAGIILGSVLLSGLGVWGAAVGAVVGALFHLLIQIPFVRELGFRFVPRISINDPDFRRVMTLAAPRMLELVVLQVAKSVELFLSTLISVASYTYFTFANSLQLFPVALFGYPFAKAALPTLSTHAARHDKDNFAATLAFTLGQIVFFVVPIAVALLVLRIPLVRLAFGTQRFTWEATVQTGLALSAFAVGVVAQAILAVLTRSFYALNDTKTPMVASIAAMGVYILLAFFLIREVGAGVWGIALAFSLTATVQALVLFLFLNARVGVLTKKFIGNVGKILFSSSLAGALMYLLLKVLDQAVWDKRLSFLGELGLALPTGFERFVIDTRYTANLVFLTFFVLTVGIFVYLLLAVVLKIREVEILARWVGQVWGRALKITPQEVREPETPAPLPPGG